MTCAAQVLSFAVALILSVDVVHFLLVDVAHFLSVAVGFGETASITGLCKSGRRERTLVASAFDLEARSRCDRFEHGFTRMPAHA